MSSPTRLPTPEYADAAHWVRHHLDHLFPDAPSDAPARRGGQTEADAAWDAFDVTGYARRRSMVEPPSARGASALSPYVRHGLLPLPRLLAEVEGPTNDVRRFRDELLWQEYCRHLYARAGTATRHALRREPAVGEPRWDDAYPDEMACVRAVRTELEHTGWIVNQTRMWMASQHTVRAGHRWEDGEDWMFRHLLDGSRAANRFGWQWTVGAMTSKPYKFSRQQVRKRAPECCDRCVLADACPIASWGTAASGEKLPDAHLKSGDDLAGPASVDTNGEPTVVWLTAESLGDDDPALAAHPDLPVVFVFDEPLLAQLQLSAKRLVFLAETLADLAARRDVQCHLGDPVAVLAGERPAVTHAPVPGFQRRRAQIDVAALHPWPWVRRPDGGDVRSYSSWIRRR